MTANAALEPAQVRQAAELIMAAVDDDAAHCR
jgi:hypothetical protein